MNFREYAAKEASELAARLTEAAATAADHAAKRAADEAQKITDALREQFDAAVAEKTAVSAQLGHARAQEERLQAELHGAHARIDHLQGELTGTQEHAGRLQSDLNDAHARGERQQAELTESYAEAGRLQAQVKDAQERAAELQAELDAARGHTDYIRAELTNAHGQVEHLQTELRNAQGYADHLHGELKTAQARVEELQGQLGPAQEHLASANVRLESAHLELDEKRQEIERLQSARAELTAACDEQAVARRVAEKEARTALSDVETLRGELATAMRSLEQVTAARLEAEDSAAARGRILEQAEQEHGRAIAELESKLQAARSAPAPSAGTSVAAAILDDLLVGFQALAGATTISDVLTTLVEQMAAQFPRVALFRVKKGHLQGEHQIGFETYTDIAKLMLPLGMDSLPARAASSGEIESLSGDALKANRAPFNGSPAFAVSVPIVVSGETVAIVYADDSGAARAARGSGVEEARARYAEGMQRYAMALVMRLTNELKALVELQRYAASLLQEIEQMYESDVQAGKTGAELRKRLDGNLEYARSIYASRAAIEGAGAAALMDDEVGALVEARAGTPFARDLAAAAGLDHGERNAAEAS